MSCRSCGCCLGMIFVLVLSVGILIAAAFGIYCYFNPDARNTSIDVVETQWVKIKTEGDDLIEQSRGAGVPAAKPQAAPEPQVVRTERPNAPGTGRPLPLTDPSR